MFGGPMSGVVWSLMRDWRKTAERGANRQTDEAGEANAQAGDRKAWVYSGKRPFSSTSAD